MYRSFKQITLVVLLLISIFLIIPPSGASASQDITVLDNSVQIVFPASLVFKISVQSPSNITRMRLRYIVDKINYAAVISESWPEFDPNTEIHTQWTWDMRKVSLPPDAGIEYWWTIENANNKLVTEASKFKFNDINYSWKQVSSGNFNLHWYEGDEDFANELLAAALQTADRLSRDVAVELENVIDIYIYNGSGDFQRAMVNAREWTGGVAITEFGIIAIGIAPGDIAWGKGALAHELGHMVVHQITFSPYSINLPTWLDEGLAMHAEAYTNPAMQSLLQQAIKYKTLISLRSLSSPFSALTEKAYLSYAQSQSIVEFLINKYSNSKILELLNLFKSGSTQDNALIKIYGFDQDGLESVWIQTLIPENK